MNPWVNQAIREAEDAVLEARRVLECTQINSITDCVRAFVAVSEALGTLLQAVKSVER